MLCLIGRSPGLFSCAILKMSDLFFTFFFQIVCVWRSETTLESVLFYLPIASQNQTQVARFVWQILHPFPLRLFLSHVMQGIVQNAVLLLSYKVSKEWEGSHSCEGSWDGKITKKAFYFCLFWIKEHLIIWSTRIMIYML